MEGFTASTMPKMDWSSGDLLTAWKSFQQHCEFAFGGPLKGKSEEERCNYLMLWVGEKAVMCLKPGIYQAKSPKSSLNTTKSSNRM